MPDTSPPRAGPDDPDRGLAAASAEALLPIVHAELRRLAQDRLAREHRAHTLAPTELVHEAFLRIVGDRPDGWASRGQFFAAAAEAMRRILIEHARSRGRLRRGGGRQRITLSAIDLADEQQLDQILDLDQAFERLAQHDARAADVVRLRFYAGLSEEETAALLGLTTRTVRRDWSYARAWLFDALRERE